jgi:hypothetical protein
LPKPPGTGQFGSILLLHVAVEGEQVPRILTVPFKGRLLPRFWAAPSQLVLQAEDRALSRRVRISHIEDVPFVIGKTSVLPSWLQLRKETEGQRTEHFVVLTVLSDRSSQRNAVVELTCRDTLGNTLAVSLPVRVIDTTPHAGSPPHATTSRPAPATLALTQTLTTDQVMTHAAQTMQHILKLDVPAATPNWIKAHAILAHGSSTPTMAPLQPLSTVVDALLSCDPRHAPAFTLRRGLPHPKSYPRYTHEPFLEEDHRDQYLHVLSMAAVPLHTPLRVNAQPFTVQDLLRNSLAEARTSGDLSWTVSA